MTLGQRQKPIENALTLECFSVAYKVVEAKVAIFAGAMVACPSSVSALTQRPWAHDGSAAVFRLTW